MNSFKQKWNQIVAFLKPLHLQIYTVLIFLLLYGAGFWVQTHQGSLKVYAVSAIEKNRPARALKILSVLDLTPEVLALRAKALFMMGAKEDAEAVLRKAIVANQQAVIENAAFLQKIESERKKSFVSKSAPR